MLSLRVLVVVLSSAYASLPNTVEIAPGVHMPLLSFGMSNRSLFIEAGGRGLDTAWVYGDLDQLETGESVRSSGLKRSELFVTTKIPCCPSAFLHICNGNETMMHTHADEHIHHDFDLLGLDYVDLLLLHWPCDNFQDTLSVYGRMEAVIAAGKARAIGVSNFNASMLGALVEKVSVKPAVNQVAFSVGNHDAHRVQPWGSDDTTLAKANSLGITTMAWSPLGGVSQVDVLHNPTVLSIASQQNKSAAQIALRWLVQQEIAVVSSSTSRAHDEGDLQIFDFELSANDMLRLSGVQANIFFL